MTVEEIEELIEQVASQDRRVKSGQREIESQDLAALRALLKDKQRAAAGANQVRILPISSSR